MIFSFICVSVSDEYFPSLFVYFWFYLFVCISLVFGFCVCSSSLFLVFLFLFVFISYLLCVSTILFLHSCLVSERMKGGQDEWVPIGRRSQKRRNENSTTKKAKNAKNLNLNLNFSTRRLCKQTLWGYCFKYDYSC